MFVFSFVLKGNLLFPLACQWEINGRCAFLDSANTRARAGPRCGTLGDERKDLMVI